MDEDSLGFIGSMDLLVDHGYVHTYTASSPASFSEPDTAQVCVDGSVSPLEGKDAQWIYIGTVPLHLSRDEFRLRKRHRLAPSILPPVSYVPGIRRTKDLSSSPRVDIIATNLLDGLLLALGKVHGHGERRPRGWLAVGAGARCGDVAQNAKVQDS